MFAEYVDTLSSTVASCIASQRNGELLPIEDAVINAGKRMREAHNQGKKVIFIGHGGSAGICSHMATDYSKNGGIRSMAMNDGSVLTCLGNDYGYEHVFEKQIEWHAHENDILVAISSSGASANILNGVAAGRRAGCFVISLSGFGADNPLRQTGDLNFYLANPNYGFVEVGHLVILHSILDIQMGWSPQG